MQKNFKSGFIAVIGRTNVGKSTLLNTLMGQKLTIVSQKPQTTRNNIRLIRTTETSQMVFIDTPGFHKPKTKLGSFMVTSAQNAASEVDLVLLVLEPDIAIGKGDMMILEKLEGASCPVIAVINKIDTIEKAELLKKMELLSRYDFIDEIIPLSALKNDNTETLISAIEKYLPQGPMFFPEDMVTDRAERFIISETIREKLLNCLNEEIPHGVAVEIMSLTQRDESGFTDIDATIYCERKSHKGIIIGKHGDMLKKIGTRARYDIEAMLGVKVNLTLWVKVRDKWKDKPFDLSELGYTQEKDF